MMAPQVVSLEKLAEAQEAADAAVEAAGAAMEAATLAAEKVAEVRGGDDLTAGQVAHLEKPAKAQEVNGGGMSTGIGSSRTDRRISRWRASSAKTVRRVSGRPTGFSPRSRRASGSTTS
jgi:hypothetical protein